MQAKRAVFVASDLQRASTKLLQGLRFAFNRASCVQEREAQEQNQIEWIRMAAGVSTSQSESTMTAAAARAARYWRFHHQADCDPTRLGRKKPARTRKAPQCAALLCIDISGTS